MDPRKACIIVFCLSFLVLTSCNSQTQPVNTQSSAARTHAVSTPPKVTQIDLSELREVIKPKGKPLLINFWATWCGPCREEFPDLVKIGNEHKDKIDLITVTLDDPAEIDGEVKTFLTEMNSDFPTYLLKTPDESAAIDVVSKDWQGALPFTILFTAQGATVYSVQGKFKADVLAAAIEKL